LFQRDKKRRAGNGPSIVTRFECDAAASDSTRSQAHVGRAIGCAVALAVTALASPDAPDEYRQPRTDLGITVQIGEAVREGVRALSLAAVGSMCQCKQSFAGAADAHFGTGT
jgi:hypothetical protein